MLRQLVATNLTSFKRTQSSLHADWMYTCIDVLNGYTYVCVCCQFEFTMGDLQEGIEKVERSNIIF